MPKSRKQIQQEYRQRRDKDVERRQNYLEKEHMKYRQDLASGKRKRVIDMDEREARKQRREWKKRRQSRKVQQDRVRTDMCTPPRTASETGGHQISSEGERAEIC